MANSKRVMGGRGGAGLAAALALVMLAGGTAMAQDTTSDSGDTAAAENGGAIPGTGKPAHMLDNLGAAYGPLPDAAGRGRIARLVADL